MLSSKNTAKPCAECVVSNLYIRADTCRFCCYRTTSKESVHRYTTKMDSLICPDFSVAFLLSAADHLMQVLDLYEASGCGRNLVPARSFAIAAVIDLHRETVSG